MKPARSTTILAVRRNGTIALGGDGQVTLQNTVVKSDAVKVRRLNGGKVLVGFAGAAADAFALLERFDKMLAASPDHMKRAAIELSKEWRTDRALRRLEAMLVVADARDLLLLSGAGDVIEPGDGVIAVGSGGNYATAAARALLLHSSLSATEIVRASLEIAADLCIYTNRAIHIEEIGPAAP